MVSAGRCPCCIFFLLLATISVFFSPNDGMYVMKLKGKWKEILKNLLFSNLLASVPFLMVWTINGQLFLCSVYV